MIIQISTMKPGKRSQYSQ